MNSSTFKIYNASAGSGKTFALAKHYLALMLASKSSDPYKHILAITFTNKAVGEMKTRIINYLKVFSSEDILVTSNDMFDMLCEELNMDKLALHSRAKQLLKSIIHNYAAFEVSTIDRFTQKLIRAFALDLRLPVNFKVELDTNEIFAEAIDNLIARAGNDIVLTNILVSFAISKVDDDRSYNIELDFMPIAQLLNDENHRVHLKSISHKSIDDFLKLKKQLEKLVATDTTETVKQAHKVLQLIDEAGLQHDDFFKSQLPKYFNALASGHFNINFTTKWQNNIATETLYPKRVSDDVKAIIDELQPTFVEAFEKTKQLVARVKLHQAALKNLTPLMVLNEIGKEVEAIKKENNSILISEFNSIVSEHLQKQPVAYIYERIGEKFKHYFIDEFQDTSTMQWENLIPLIANALAGEQASAFLVGDAKQAIYRWRGGKAEQFINLFSLKQNPFHIQPDIINLDFNYRSCKAVVDFNNKFFRFLSENMFKNDQYAKLYEQSKQTVVDEIEGYVRVSFLQLEDHDKDELYASKVLSTINDCLNNGFQPKDICVLVRKRKQGVAVANFIIEHSSIDVMSSETLLLISSPKVVFIVNVLKYLTNPNHDLVKAELLDFIANKQHIEDPHQFFKAHLALSPQELFEALKTHNIHFNADTSIQYSVYELVEIIISQFGLNNPADAYIQYFLDVVLEFTLKHEDGLLGFLDYFESNKEKLSITASENLNAVRVMTIHKSKGLEFPVVIFPYADVDIYYEKQHYVWYPVAHENYLGFDYLMLRYSSALLDYDEISEQKYWMRKAELELDNINLLYVTLTRAAEQLYIVSNDRALPKKDARTLYYSQLLKSYLSDIGLWEEGKRVYEFGEVARSKKPDSKVEIDVLELPKLISSPLSEHAINFVAKSGLLWDTNQEKAIEKGNIIHELMALIKFKHDVPFAMNELKQAGVISSEQENQLLPIINAVINHPKLASYFTSTYDVYIEKEIILSQGTILKPDRVMTKNGEAILLDYKTGQPNNKHIAQLEGYAKALKVMDFDIEKKILVYINDDIEVVEF